MRRIELAPRPDWERTIKQSGLIYSHSVRDDGSEVLRMDAGADPEAEVEAPSAFGEFDPA